MTEEEKKYKEEQRSRISSLVVGAKDKSGNTITKVFARGDEYVVYEIKTKVISESLRVDIDTEKEFDEEPINNFAAIRGQYTLVKGLLYKVNDDASIKSRIAHMVSHAINGKTEEANKQFDELIHEINTEYSAQFRHRTTYLVTHLVLTLVLITCSILVYYKGERFVKLSELRTLIFIATSGAVGGFLSLSRRLKTTIFEKDVKSYLYVMYGIERVCVSVFGSVIVYFTIRSNLFFGITNDLTEPLLGYILFSILAGFSESFVPDLLSKLEKESD